MNKNQSHVRRPEATRRKIIAAAGELFSERGFHGVGFREIAAKAGVSLQMPNHHFGTKKRLFAECVRYAFKSLTTIFAEPPSANPAETRHQIAAKVRACFFAVHPPSGRPSWHGDLAGRVLSENLAESLSALQDGLRPALEWFSVAIKQIHPRYSPAEYLLWYCTLWAQVSFYVTARPAILARSGKKHYDASFLKTVADHLVQLMLNQLEK